MPAAVFATALSAMLTMTPFPTTP
ncbi:MAG: hypothetical protein RIR77_1273, partial [Planctomycetota bacterium]